MARPLRYDDSFTSIINEKVHDKFLLFFNIKVQSTGFHQRLNLQRSLMLSGLIDLIFGCLFSLAFFANVNKAEHHILFILENFILMISFCFGCVGIDAATNLRKFNTKIYKNWRYFITFAFPFLEIINNFNFLCIYNTTCETLNGIIFVLLYFLLNIYLSKIAWSFFIRLQRGHELLIIHGKYLEKMINDESYKINDLKKYVPPETLMIKTTETEMSISRTLS
jgi:hypothetical protein